MISAFLDLARLRDIAPNITSINERLNPLTLSTDAHSERSRIFTDLCQLYESIAPFAQHTSELSESPSARAPANRSILNMRASIDSLLDQLSAIDTKNRLWIVKASLVFDQIRMFADSETQRLQKLVLTGESAPIGLSNDFSRAEGRAWERSIAA